MTEADLGKATILYETPDGETVEETVDNEHVVYFQDHWIVKTGEHEEGHDVIRRIPAQRVYFVERNVEEFENEVRTLLDDVQSFADGISQEVETIRDRVEKLPGGLLGGASRTEDAESDPLRIDIEDDPDESPDADGEANGNDAPDEDDDR